MEEQMVAIIFEVIPNDEEKPEYLSIAARLKERLIQTPGFKSIEYFQSLTDPQKLLSLSFWEDEESVSRWRNLQEHRHAQASGRDVLFHHSRIRVGHIVRDHSLSDGYPHHSLQGV
jgi:heme-degrading monooxygenase HmoA